MAECWLCSGEGIEGCKECAMTDKRIDLRLGDYRQVMQDVTCDAVIVDAPYSAKTHSGHDDKTAGLSGHRRELSYSFWHEQDVSDFCDFWRDRCTGWIVTITDHVLAPVWAAQLERTGRYAFAPLPWVATGSRVRLAGDGPSSWTCWIVVARPKSRKFATWGTLPGAYVIGAGNHGTFANGAQNRHIGGKPVQLMREIIKDYSREGDLVCDPCAGYGSTLAAAVKEGRRAVGCELDPTTYAKARELLDPSHSPLFAPRQTDLF